MLDYDSPVPMNPTRNECYAIADSLRYTYHHYRHDHGGVDLSDLADRILLMVDLAEKKSEEKK